MDPKLLKALAENRILIDRKVSAAEPTPTDNSELLERCMRLSYPNTEQLIFNTDEPHTKPEESKKIWDSIVKRLFRS